MARYINADELKERLEDFSKWCRDGRKQGVDFVLDCPLPNMPNADVAPRAELAREIFEEIAQIKKEYASGDIGGDTLYAMLYLLEKKYTEDDPPKANP